MTFQNKYGFQKHFKAEAAALLNNFHFKIIFLIYFFDIITLKINKIILI